MNAISPDAILPDPLAGQTVTGVARKRPWLKAGDRPTLYQEEAARACVGHLRTGGQVLLVAPMGSGKSATIGMTAQAYLDELAARRGPDAPPPKVLVLTHRRRLHAQLSDDIAYWTGETVGCVAAEADGGIRQEPRIVVGMVQTAASHLDALAQYDLVVIDEAHHARGAAERDAGETDATGEDMEAASAYDAVLRHLEPRGRVAVWGGTASDFRADEAELDERLRAAPRHTISYAEVMAADRIVAPRTIRPPYALNRQGQTVESLVAEMREGGSHERVAAGVGAALRAARRDDFADQAVAAWLKHAKGKKTMCFVDSVAEMEALVAAFAREDIEVDMVSSSRSDKANTSAFRRYEGKEAPPLRGLVSCRMVGEGYNVPDTDCVLLTNRCTTRSWYAQMIGRAMRASRNGCKEEALVIDMGATSLVWGALERQIVLSDRQLELGPQRNAVAAAAMLAATWHQPAGDPRLMVLPSEERVLFAAPRADGRWDVLHMERAVGRATARKSATQFYKRLARPGVVGTEATKAWSTAELVAETRREIEARFGWHAVNLDARQPGPDGTQRTRWEAQAEDDYARAASSLNTFLGGPPQPVAVVPVARSMPPSKPGETRRRTARDILLDGGHLLGALARALDPHADAEARRASQAAAAVIVHDYGADRIKKAPDEKVMQMLRTTAGVLGQASDGCRRAGDTRSARVAADEAEMCRKAAALLARRIEERGGGPGRA